MRWLSGYIGQKWTHEKDCWFWFRKIQLEVFGRSVDPVMNDWAEIYLPENGDGVLLSRGSNPDHIGMVIFINDRFHVLHALEGAGVILTDRQSLKMNGWKINGYWTPARDQTRSQADI